MRIYGRSIALKVAFQQESTLKIRSSLSTLLPVLV